MASPTLLSRTQCLLLYILLLVYVYTTSSGEVVIYVLLKSLLLSSPLEIIVRITSSPSSKVIVLGDNATFYCSGSGSSFQIIIKNNLISVMKTRIIRENLTSPDHTYGIITAQVISQFTGREFEHTGMVTFEGRIDTNNTELYCWVFSYPQEMSSDSATLIVIGKKNIWITINLLYLQNTIAVYLHVYADRVHVHQTCRYYSR